MREWMATPVQPSTPARRDDRLSVRVAVAVVIVIATGAARRRASARKHIGGPGQGAGRGPKRATNNGADRTRRSVTARRTGRLARYRTGYRVGIPWRSDWLAHAATKRISR